MKDEAVLTHLTVNALQVSDDTVLILGALFYPPFQALEVHKCRASGASAWSNKFPVGLNADPTFLLWLLQRGVHYVDPGNFKRLRIHRNRMHSV